jgi:hypothetical protein
MIAASSLKYRNVPRLIIHGSIVVTAAAAARNP